jgi:glycosyltransferase Alg8
MDQQSWTRQKTVLDRGLGSYQLWFNRWSSRAMTFTAGSLFAAFILQLV